MTKKEIEERLQKEMHQNIPDKDALWQKIENRLPEQPVSQPVRRNLKMTSGSRFMTIAACFLLVIAGMRFFSTVKNLNQPNETAAENSAVPADDAEAGENALAENQADTVPEYPAVVQQHTENQEILKYQNLHLPQGENIASQVNLSRLGTDGEYFSEDEILAKTSLFIDVKILEGAQNPDSGKMEYTLQILDVYGGELNAETITLETSSAYILEQNHEYVLPVTADCSLAYECAPQIEKTQDNKLVIPNGWYTLMQGETTPVLYDSIGKDDYFYDRMYLTKDLNLDLLIQKWQSL
ncbi:MAG: hypothetical protein IJJ69_14525 [Oscillospiraceae bacterium]|nr:hypothetical protein [Oscillospiraceae bacterium]